MRGKPVLIVKDRGFSEEFLFGEHTAAHLGARCLFKNWGMLSDYENRCTFAETEMDTWRDSWRSVRKLSLLDWFDLPILRKMVSLGGRRRDIAAL